VTDAVCPADLSIFEAQVRWSDPDQLGHVNHARYLSFFEDARMMLLAASPTGLPGARHAGNGWSSLDGSERSTSPDRGCIAARVAVDYAAPVEFRPGLTLRIESSVAAIGTTSWTLAQRMFDGDTQVAHCECVLVAYSYAERKPRPLEDDERAYWLGFTTNGG
jgi:acyl-CoA thioester hydrolase